MISMTTATIEKPKTGTTIPTTKGTSAVGANVRNDISTNWRVLCRLQSEGPLNASAKRNGARRN
ncbi:Uncharacterised protein [uncultured archaeon]|nr:Uncharacterised protein [uncultured archaeon]